MKWSWKLGTIAGIGIYVHSTFVLVLIWVGFISYSQTQEPLQAVEGVVFVLLLFGCIVLHELGHALMARRFGYRTRDITLLPIGGVARLERMPEDPGQEFAVAIAGPLVNVAIFGVLAVSLTGAGVPIWPPNLELVGGNFLSRMAWINLMLAVFNLLPAFPMDGGRVLRALLGRRMPFTEATRIAATVGQMMAFVFGLLGLLFNPFLLLIAFFVYMAASEEAAVVQMRTVFAGICVDHAMMTQFSTLDVNDPLGRAVQLLIDGSQHDFPVFEEGRPVGILTRGALFNSIKQNGEEALVGAVMQPGIQTVHVSDHLDHALTPLQTRQTSLLAVLADDDGEVVGLLTMENVGEYVMIHQARNEAGWRRQHPHPTLRQ